MKQFVTVEEEYAKNKNVTPSSVQSIMEWLEKQPHLPKMTEVEITFFLNCYNGSIEQAKGLIEIYYTTKTHCPEFFLKRNPKGLVDNMDVILCYHFPTKPNSIAIYLTLMDTDASKFDINESLKILAMTFDLRLAQEGAVNDYQCVIDMKGATFGHIAKLSFVTLKKGLFILQEAIPVPISYFHVINVVPVAYKILALCKPFLRKELVDKIIFHEEGLGSLYKYIQKETLPQHLGGNGPTLSNMHASFKDNLLDNSEFFEEEEKTKRVDETKRVGKPKNAGELFGIEGSFKKLDID